MPIASLTTTQIANRCFASGLDHLGGRALRVCEFRPCTNSVSPARLLGEGTCTDSGLPGRERDNKHCQAA